MSAHTSLVFVDPETMKPVRPPGFGAPKGGVGYHDPRVQEVLELSYGPIFPKLLEQDGRYFYESRDARGRETCALSEPVRNMADIPKGELLRLMEGWIKCRRLLQLQDFPNRVESILLNFKVPNPRRSLESYRIYQDGERTRLHVLWGFEADSAASVSVEKALSILLGVPESHMHSILSAAMPAPGETTSTVPVGVNLDTAAIASLAQQQLSGGRRGGVRVSGYVLAGLVGVILLGIGMMVPGMLRSGAADEVVEIRSRAGVRRERGFDRAVAERNPGPVDAAAVQWNIELPPAAAADAAPAAAQKIRETLPAEVSAPDAHEPLVMTAPAEQAGERLDLDGMAGVTAAPDTPSEAAPTELLDEMSAPAAGGQVAPGSDDLNMIINS